MGQIGKDLSQLEISPNLGEAREHLFVPSLIALKGMTMLSREIYLVTESSIACEKYNDAKRLAAFYGTKVLTVYLCDTAAVNVAITGNEKIEE